MTPLFAAIAIGILAYIIFVVLVPKAVPKESDDYLRSALDRLADENRAAEAARNEVLRDQLNQESALVRGIFGLPFMRPIYKAGLQAGYQGELQSLLVVMMITFGLVLLLGYYAGLGALSIAAALILAYYVPLRNCKKRIVKRNRKFIDQFPDALDMIVRSVRSGFPLAVALNMLAENAEEPVKAEFRQVTDEIALGRTLSQALQRLAARINEPDIRFFVVVLTVQQETGGNLAEIVGNLSNIIRKRKQLRHKIRAMTSEGRATAWVLGLLPVFVFVALLFLQPDYLRPFWTDPLGMVLFGTAVSFIGLCVFVVNQMVNVEV